MDYATYNVLADSVADDPNKMRRIEETLPARTRDDMTPEQRDEVVLKYLDELPETAQNGKESLCSFLNKAEEFGVVIGTDKDSPLFYASRPCVDYGMIDSLRWVMLPNCYEQALRQCGEPITPQECENFLKVYMSLDLGDRNASDREHCAMKSLEGKHFNGPEIFEEQAYEAELDAMEYYPEDYFDEWLESQCGIELSEREDGSFEFTFSERMRDCDVPDGRSALDDLCDKIKNLPTREVFVADEVSR